MATLMRQTLPEGVPVEMLDAVTKEMNVDNDLPPGMIVHVHYFDQGRARVVDVWSRRTTTSVSGSRASCPPCKRSPRSTECN